MKSLPALTLLNLGQNQISEIPANGLENCLNLKHLYLNNNNLTKWASINPNLLFLPATNLETLSLGGNGFTSFSSIDQTLILISDSLKLLDLSGCQITKVTGQYVLGGNTNIHLQH